MSFRGDVKIIERTRFYMVLILGGIVEETVINQRFSTCEPTSFLTQRSAQDVNLPRTGKNTEV